MINKENIPKGKDFEQLHVNNYGGYVQIETSKYYGQGLDLLDCEHVGIKQAEANGELFVEAFNVFNKTGMTPEELAKKVDNQSLIDNYDLKKQIEKLQQERDELLNLLDVLNHYGNTGEDAVAMKDEIRVFLKSLTTQQEENK